MSAPRQDRQALAIQRQAARPDTSVVLRASAGSGKTRVLVDRLVRLLLAGTNPKGIVALTFTRKAAAEIQERLQSRLARYARLPEEALRRELAGLLDREPTPGELRRSADLAEILLEDPTGLLIGTIHTFCQTILSRFADTLGLDPRFTILEPVAPLWDEALDRLEREVAADPTAAGAWSTLFGTPDQARDVLAELLFHRLALDRWIARVLPEHDPLRDGRTSALPALAADLAAVLLPPALLAADGLPLPPEEARAALAADLAAACREYGTTGLDAVAAAGTGSTASLQQALAARRQAARRAAADLAADRAAGRDPTETIRRLLPALLTRKGTPLKLNGPKADQPARNAVNAEALAPLLAAVRRLDHYRLWQRQLRLLEFGLRALDLYDQQKRRDGCLDFHDLEWLACHALNREDLGAWLQYRLDAVLEHLLVDEFQDTNRNQWSLLRPLAREFLAGEGRTDRPRTVFLVGDVKQSIYRFRGARPEMFAAVADELRAAAAVDTLTLPTNFRSLRAVVQAVGDRFGRSPLRDLLPPGEHQTVVQRWFRDEAPGEVQLLAPEPDGDDARGREAARVVRILWHLKRHGQVIDPETGVARPPRWSDVLLLVRSRNHLARYEEALREAGIPFAPSGRGALAASREVQDILALLRWLLLPDDDAALATVLRSPLLRVPEANLLGLLAGRRRGRSLWRTLREDTTSLPAGVARLLSDWLGRVEHESPSDLLRRVYRDTDALVRYELALGEQAAYNLLRLHDLALSHEQAPFPSLRSLAEAIADAAVAGSEEEAALPERGDGRVRLMTIHGAKGLEAPVVLLLDTAAPFNLSTNLLDLGNTDPDPTRWRDAGPLFWRDADRKRDRLLPPAGDEPVILAAARHRAMALREEGNLLYVALTRARDQLWSTGATPSRTQDQNQESHAGWLAEAGGLAAPPDWSDPAAPAPAGGGAAAAEPVTAASIQTWRPPVLRPLLEVVTPSTLARDGTVDAGSVSPPADPAAADAADDVLTGGGVSATAADHGTRVHRWLQMAVETGTPPPVTDAADREAHAVWSNPDLGWLFRGEGERLAEVPVLGRLAEGPPERRLLGVVDLLLIRRDTVHVVDFKTGQSGATDPEALARRHAPQLEAYRRVLAAIHPDRPVRCWVVATAAPTAGGRGVAVELTPPAAGS